MRAVGYIAIILFFMLLLQSCKQGKKVESEISIEKKPDIFSLKISGIFEKNESLTLFYLTSEAQEISIKNSKQIDILGSEYDQTVQFNLPEKVIPTRILVRFGDKENKKIHLGDITIRYGEKTINVPDSLFIRYFKPNKNAVFIDSLNIISSKNLGNLAPMFFSRQLLEREIDLTFL